MPVDVVNEGSVGALDTETGDFEFVQGDWLGDYGREGGFQLLADTVKNINRGRHLKVEVGYPV